MNKDVEKEERARILCIAKHGNQGVEEVNPHDEAWREFVRGARVREIYVRDMVNLGLSRTEAGQIMKERKLTSTTVAVFPFTSGRTLVIGRANDCWLVWDSAEDTVEAMDLVEGLEVNPAWSLRIPHIRALYTYIRIISNSRDILMDVNDFTRLVFGFLCALGYRQSIARAA